MLQVVVKPQENFIWRIPSPRSSQVTSEIMRRETELQWMEAAEVTLDRASWGDGSPEGEEHICNLRNCSWVPWDTRWGWYAGGSARSGSPSAQVHPAPRPAPPALWTAARRSGPRSSGRSSARPSGWCGRAARRLALSRRPRGSGNDMLGLGHYIFITVRV